MNKEFEEYLKREMSDRTREMYRSILGNFEEWLIEHNTSVKEMTDEHVKQYYKQKMEKKEWNGSMIILFLRIIRSYCNIEKRKIDRKIPFATGKKIKELQKEHNRLDDITLIKNPKIPQEMVVDELITMDELARVFKAMIENDPDLLDFDTWWCLCYFGTRETSEYIPVNPSRDINLDKNTIVFITGKTKVPRLMVFDDFTKRIMERWVEDPSRLHLKYSMQWKRRIHPYGKVTDKKMKVHTVIDKVLKPHMGRKIFDTYMDNRLVLKREEVFKKFNLVIDSNFTKWLTGHTISNDMTERYRLHSHALKKMAMVDLHYLRDVEKELEPLL